MDPPGDIAIGADHNQRIARQTGYMHFSGARNIGLALRLAALGAPCPPTFNLFSNALYHLVSV
ncbi:hypothetical protein GCM10008012_20140 [Rhizobium anhuiense]|nr:hypothetical protein GCM10008012_20140 [Rhizobium anhuiense]